MEKYHSSFDESLTAMPQTGKQPEIIQKKKKRTTLFYFKSKVWTVRSTPQRMFTAAPAEQKAIKGQFALYEIQIKQK